MCVGCEREGKWAHSKHQPRCRRCYRSGCPCGARRRCLTAHPACMRCARTPARPGGAEHPAARSWTGGSSWGVWPWGWRPLRGHQARRRPQRSSRRWCASRRSCCSHRRRPAPAARWRSPHLPLTLQRMDASLRVSCGLLRSGRGAGWAGCRAGREARGSTLHPPPTHAAPSAAVGDLHGDWQKAIDSLRAAKVIRVGEKEEIVWSGGDTVVVQLGDVLDRGDNEIGRRASPLFEVTRAPIRARLAPGTRRQQDSSARHASQGQQGSSSVHAG